MDEHYDYVTDAMIDRFLADYHPDAWHEDINDCDDIAFEFRCDAKRYFRERYNINATIGFLARASTPSQKAHAFNFYVLGTHRLVFLDKRERVLINGRAYLVIL